MNAAELRAAAHRVANTAPMGAPSSALNGYAIDGAGQYLGAIRHDGNNRERLRGAAFDTRRRSPRPRRRHDRPPPRTARRRPPTPRAPRDSERPTASPATSTPNHDRLARRRRSPPRGAPRTTRPPTPARSRRRPPSGRRAPAGGHLARKSNRPTPHELTTGPRGAGQTGAT